MVLYFLLFLPVSARNEFFFLLRMCFRMFYKKERLNDRGNVRPSLGAGAGCGLWFILC